MTRILVTMAVLVLASAPAFAQDLSDEEADDLLTALDYVSPFSNGITHGLGCAVISALGGSCGPSAGMIHRSYTSVLEYHHRQVDHEFFEVAPYERLDDSDEDTEEEEEYLLDDSCCPSQTFDNWINGCALNQEGDALAECVVDAYERCCGV